MSIPEDTLRGVRAQWLRAFTLNSCGSLFMLGLARGAYRCVFLDKTRSPGTVTLPRCYQTRLKVACVVTIGQQRKRESGMAILQTNWELQSKTRDAGWNNVTHALWRLLVANTGAAPSVAFISSFEATCPQRGPRIGCVLCKRR